MKDKDKGSSRTGLMLSYQARKLKGRTVGYEDKTSAKIRGETTLASLLIKEEGSPQGGRGVKRLKGKSPESRLQRWVRKQLLHWVFNPSTAG